MYKMNTALLAVGKKSSMRPKYRMAHTQSFSQVYTTYRHKIYSYVYYRVGNDTSVTEDVVSDVFVKAYQKFDTQMIKSSIEVQGCRYDKGCRFGGFRPTKNLIPI